MKRVFTRPAAVFACVCIAMCLMCTFFVDEADAADVVSGKTAKKEQTVKVKLSKGAAVITVSDADSWVFAQLQKTGGDTIGEALGGEKLLASLGMEKTFVAPVKKEGTYYLYLHGTNDGAKYSVRSVKSGGTLTSGKAKTSTSFADNETVVWHTIKAAKAGQLRVTVKDASRRYPGYSKVRLKKDGVLLTQEEHLVKGLGYSTVFGVSKGTYKIGVRSSSELYKITAEAKALKIAECGGAKGDAVQVAKKTRICGKIEPGDVTESWYKAVLPERKASGEKRVLTISAENNNAVTSGGISVKVSYKEKKNGELVTESKEYLLNNSKKSLEISALKNKKNNVFIRVKAAEGATGTYTVYWK